MQNKITSIDIWMKWKNLQKIYFFEYFQLQCDQDVTDAKAITINFIPVKQVWIFYI